MMNTHTINLYCFPYAGGNARIYQHWQQLLPKHIKVHPVELPGHGLRFSEPLIEDYTTLVDQLVKEIGKNMRHAPQPCHYACFGHSAGAALSFAVCRGLTKMLGSPPLHCFISAGVPPHVNKKERSSMSDAQLCAEITSLAGTPKEILDEPDLIKLFLPTLRADFKVYEQSSSDKGTHLDCPLTLFAALNDLIPLDIIWSWSQYTLHPSRRVILNGDHFTILQSPEQLIKQITYDLQV